MPQQDTDRIGTLEQQNTFIGWDQAEINKEISSRIDAANCWMTVTTVSDVITQIDYFADAAKTKLRIRRTFTRTIGADNVPYITGVLSIFYNIDGSEDSRVTTTVQRTDDVIDGCDNVFSTGESIC